MEPRVGQITVTHSARGVPTYAIELWHDGLKKHRVIRDGSQEIARRKAELQVNEWHSRWSAVATRQGELARRVFGRQRQEDRRALAIEQTTDAQSEFDQLSKLLAFTLSVSDAIDWEKLKDKSLFPESQPILDSLPSEPKLPTLPNEPVATDAMYQPALGILDKLMRSRREQRTAEKLAKFEIDHEKWARNFDLIKRTHLSAIAAHQSLVEIRRQEHATLLSKWNHRKAHFLAEQSERHSAIDAKRFAYEAVSPDAITEYCDLVLSASQYPNYFPQEFDLDYEPKTKVLVVDYVLPSPSDMPSLKTVRYVASRDEFEELKISDSAAAKIYDDSLYQIVLRTVHELFEADTVGALQAVVFNGIVTSVDRSTGQEVTACVLSLRANREEFLLINLSQVDPKACFKSLKGVGSSKLHGLAPVPPIMPLRREDGRFVSAYEVANTLDASVNLASMDWEDFEHLIREVFEKEFSSSGGEVKVTQASRDGGVDAVAFDPDPIRGGKIVIQAKRYTNTVGVSAVRDLYGTVLNEGATKGVLVTTSDYGPDSYSFASGKPLVLLSGANLLHMLEKHGHKARIDIHEAKKLAAK